MATKPKVGQIAATKPRFEYVDVDQSQLTGARFYDDSPVVAETEAPEAPGMLRRIGDTAVQFGQGAVTGVKMMSDIFGANNAVSSGLSDVNQALDGLLSATAQGDKQKVAQIMQEAEGKGWGEQIVAGLKAAGVDPVGLAANALGTSLPTMATMLIPGAGPAAVAARMGAGVAMGAGQGVGAVKGQIYDETKRKWLEARATPEQAEAKAQEAAAYGGANTDQIAIGGVLGMGSVLGAERALGKVLHGASKAGPGMLGRVATSTLAETGTEMLQGGQEKFATNTALNRQGFDVDPMSGVIANATLGGAAAAPMGAVAGIPKPAVATAPGIDPAKEAADAIRNTEKVPESGALTKAVNAGVEAKAQAIEAGAPLLDEQAAAEPVPEPVDDPVRDQILALPDGARQDALRAYAVVNRDDVAKGVLQYNRKLLDRLLAENQPKPVLGDRLTDTDMGAMLGGGGMIGSADPLMGALGMNREAQANSITNVAQAAQNRPPMPASDAVRMLDEARNRGLDLAVAEHPAGGFVIVPPAWITPDMAAQGETRLAETIARMQQADAAPVERVPRNRISPVDLNLQTDPVQNFIGTLRTVNTPAAQAFVRDFEAGRITPADVQQRMQAEQGMTPEQRIARAAAEAPATADPVADRLRSAAAQAATVTPTDILNPSGLPFKTKMAADLAAKKTPGAAVLPVVDGGFLVRPKESVSVQDVPQAPEAPQAAPAISQPGQAPQAVGTQPTGPAAGVPAEGAGAVEAAGVSPASVEYKKQVDTWNAKVNTFKTGNPEQQTAMLPEMDAARASLEQARQGLMRESDAAFKKKQAEQSQKDRAEKSTKYGAMPTGTRIGIAGQEQNDSAYWEKTGPDEWTRVGIGSEQPKRQSADMEGGRVISQPAPAEPAATPAAVDAAGVGGDTAPTWPTMTPEQRRRSTLEREIATGMTNNGGVMAKLRPSAIEKRKQELAAMPPKEAAGAAPNSGVAAPANQAHVATENVAISSNGQGEKTIRYELPPEKYAQQQGDESWMAAQSPSFKPTARQQLLMDAVAKALDDGAFYNSDVDEHVAKALGVTLEQRARNSRGVEGGDFGYDVYGARKAVEAQRSNAKSREFAKALNLKPGEALGTLVFNDGKVTTGVKVNGLNDSGLVVTVTGKRGAATLNGEVGIDRLAAAMDKAKERGKRKDGYAEFVAGRGAVQPSPQDFIPAPDGGLDYGEITPEMGKAMRRQAGKIRLRRGDETQGLVHIENRHNKDFAALGFKSAQDFVSQVASGFTKIYKGRGAALDVVLDDQARGMLIVSLEQSGDGDFYDIKTATPIRRDQFKNEEPLWDRAGPSASTADESSPPYPKGQNGADSVPPTAPAAQPEAPKLTPAEAKSLMAWEDLGQKDGVKTHALTFYESQADKDAKRGRMIVAKVSKGDRSATAWMVDGEDQTFGALAQAKKLAEEVGMAKAVADGFVEAAAAKPAPAAKPAAPAATIEDAGAKIGGARKDRWKERGLNLDDLDAMTEAEGAELATKANVWKPDYDALAEASEPVTAAMVKTIYDQLAAKPKKNTPEGRRQYVQMMRIVRDVLTEAKGPDAVRNAYLEIRKRAGLNTMDPKAKEAARELLFSVYKGRSDPFVMNGADLMKVKKMVDDGFPAKGEPWKARLTVGRREGGNGVTERGIEMYMELSADVGTPLSREQIEAGFFRVVDKQNKTVAFAPTKEDAEAAAETVYERDLKGKKDSKPEPVRPNLDELKRENLPQRIDRDVTSDDFVRDLGFRGVEFGLWSAQDERQRILNMAYDGLMDLAEIMGVPPKAMSLNGTLGMAFGARGGGRFAAHYEPGKLVINMTKIRGGGSMAHEWAHALDHYFGELDKADAYTTQARGASGWYAEDQYLGVPRKRMERVGNEWKSVEKMRLDNLRPEMAAAFDGVMRALFSKQITKAEMVRSHELDLERTEALARNETQADLKSMYQNMAQNKRQALNELRGDPEGTMYAGRGRSDYASQAQALSGKSENGYWTRPTEMFARAFESWVFDRVTAMGARSDYLVHGVEEDRFAGGAYKGNPYPTGEERARINAAFDKLAKTIQTKETDQGVAMFATASAPVAPGQGVTLQAAQQAVDQVLDGLGMRGVVVPKVVNNPAAAGIPTPAGVVPTGGTRNGEVYLFTDNLHDDADVFKVVFHELFHLGLSQSVKPKEYIQTMLQFMNDPLVRQHANAWKQSADGQSRIMSMPRNNWHALAVEEALADIAEDVNANSKGIGTKEMQGWVRRTIAWLADLAQSWKMPAVARKLRGMTYTQAEAFVQETMLKGRTGAPVLLPDTRFRSAADTAQAVGDTLKSITVSNIKQRAGFKFKDYLGLGLQALGRRQIVDIYGDMLPLAEYNRLVQQMEADKNEGGAEADKLVTRWAKLDDEAKLADLMHDATLAQIDPDKPYADGDDKGKFLMLQRKFKLLSDEAKAVYRDTRDAYQAHHAKVRSAIKERIERSEIKGERKAALLKQMDDEFFAAVKGVYFPLARFGQYAVTVKGADGKVGSVSRAETKAEAEALRSNLLSAFPRDKGFTVGRVMLSKDFIADRDAVGRGFMTELYQVLDKQDMDAVQRAELEDTLGQLYLSSLPDLSWAKHGIHRKGTPGFSQDARRAYAQNMFHGSRYLAKLRYSDLMQDELTAMQKHVDDWREVEDFDQNSAQRVVDEMNKRHESLMNPKSNALSTALTSFGFVFHLGLSPASAMVNLSQTALVAYPIMGAKWGFGKASAALLKASAEAAKGKNDITASLNEDERAAYDEAVRAGTIDVTMAHDLAGIAQGEDAGVMWKIRPAMRLASSLFHHAERFNRQVTFVAAYRLAREAGADHHAAFEQATKATYDGHFDYGAANRPRFMQGNVAKVLLLFKQYGQNMVYTLARNAQQSIKGESPEVRAQARKALAGLLTSHAMAAGVLGLPMVTTLLAAASMIGGDDDEPWDAKVALQNMLADTLGQKPAEVLAHGLSRLTPWDISGRVGLDRLIFPDVQEGLEGQRLWESAATQALGPVGGIFGGALKGLDLMSDGHYKLGLEAMLPAVLRQGVKSIRYAVDGAQDKTGVVIKDEVSMPAVVGQLLGFSPSEVRLAQEGKSAVYQQDRALGERRQELLTKAARATMAQDAEARAEAMKEIQRFNQKNPTRRITPLNVLQSVRNRNKRIDQAEGGIYLPKSRRDAMNAGRFAVSE